jgi:hypothetical protein
MADFNFDETRGAFARADVITPGEDSNYGRLMKKTGERLMETKLFRVGFIAQDPEDSVVSTEYPYFAVYPISAPETERTNFDNMKIYGMLGILGTLDENPYRGVLRLMAIREIAEDALRTKFKIQLKDGDFLENTLLDTAAYILPQAVGGQFMFSTGFRVNYHVTEPRKEE